MTRKRTSTKRFLRYAIPAAAIVLSSLAGDARAQREPVLSMVRAPVGADLRDPKSTFWESLDGVHVPMLPQSIATPGVAQAAISALDVRAAHDGKFWAVRMTWADSTKSDRIVVDNFGDQVAVEVPMRFEAGKLPSPMMGNPGARVAILQWRAALQHDLEFGALQLRDVYPNAIVDLYPDQVLSVIDAKPYSGARGVDNPVSTALTSAVLDQMAEGFGTMTVKAEQHAWGSGEWSGSRWKAVVLHPLSAGSENDPDVRPGRETAIAFAVWEGGHNEVGGRKAWAPWVSVTVAE